MNAKVDLIEGTKGGGSENGAGEAIGGSFRVVTSRSEVMRVVDCRLLWLEARTTAEIREALEVACVQESAGRGAPFDADAIPGFAVRGELLETARAHGFATEPPKAERLIRAMSRTVLGSDLSKAHALREGAAGTAKQVMRGKDTAWRTDVDYEFHLHYWRKETGEIEFAVLVTHNNFSIPK